MNIFNRIIMIILLIFVIVASIVIVVNIFTDLFAWSDVFHRILVFRDSINNYIAALIFLAIIVVSIVILVFEFYRKKLKTTNVAAVKDGKAMITLKSAAQQIEEDLGSIPDISNLRVKVFPKSDSAIVNIFANLTKGIDVSGKIQEVIDKANNFSRTNLGLKIIKTNFTATGFTAKSAAAPEEAVEEVASEATKDVVPSEPEEVKTTDEDYD